jgi:hypothetical protein
MNLTLAAKQRSNSLAEQRLLLQRQVRARLQVNEFSSFLITFAFMPFFAGAASQAILGSNASAAYLLRLRLFPVLRLLLPSAVPKAVSKE